jgi:hypothetical protein
MRGKIWFLGGLAAGFVLGARAGREKYEELVVQAKKVMDHPTVQEATGVAQAQASRLYSEGKDKLAHSKLGEKLGSGTNGTSTGTGSISPGGELTSSDTLAATSGTTSGTSGTTAKPRTSGSTTPSSSGTDV